MSKNAKTFIIICALLGILSGKLVELSAIAALYFGGFFVVAILKAIANQKKPEQTNEK